MNKKIYQKPKAKVVHINSTSILATSATGEDVPWAVRVRGTRTEEIIFIDEE